MSAPTSKQRRDAAMRRARAITPSQLMAGPSRARGVGRAYNPTGAMGVSPYYGNSVTHDPRWAARRPS